MLISDRLTFRALVSVAGFLLFCLACLLALSLRLGRLIGSVWVVCCTMLMTQSSMPHPVPTWLGWLTALLTSLLFSLMLGQSVIAGWQLWRATQRLTQVTHSARLSLPPVVTRLACRLNLANVLVVVPNREPLRMAIAICLSRFFFFVPLLTELRDHYLAEKEVAADAFAVAHTGRAALARALHKFIAGQPIPTIPSPAAVAGLSVTARRVDRLLNPAARPNWSPSRRSMLTVLVLFAVGCLLMFAGMV